MEEEILLYTEQYFKTINLPARMLHVMSVVSIVHSDFRWVMLQNMGGKQRDFHEQLPV